MTSDNIGRYCFRARNEAENALERKGHYKPYSRNCPKRTDKFSGNFSENSPEKNNGNYYVACGDTDIQ